MFMVNKDYHKRHQTSVFLKMLLGRRRGFVLLLLLMMMMKYVVRLNAAAIRSAMCICLSLYLSVSLTLTELLYRHIGASARQKY